MSVSIRAARAEDCRHLPDIERSAAELFRFSGMDDVSTDEVTAAEVWEPMCVDDSIWVAADEADALPFAFLASGRQPPLLFIYELAVRYDRQREGVGRALLSKAVDYAKRHALEGVALTTFCDVPWNAPYYRSEGFEVVEERDLPGGLATIMQAEHRKWTRPDRRRCAMIKRVSRG